MYNNADINNSCRLQTYCVFKHDFESVKYVDCLCLVPLEQCLQSQRKLFARQLNIHLLCKYTMYFLTFTPIDN